MDFPNNKCIMSNTNVIYHNIRGLQPLEPPGSHPHFLCPLLLVTTECKYVYIHLFYGKIIMLLLSVKCL